jgi:hypothetical protein
MKTFASVCVVAVILGVAMTGETARADFNNAQVEAQAEQMVELTTAILSELRGLGIPRGQLVTFRVGLNKIKQNAQQIAELAGQPDNQVEDTIEALARDSADRAEVLLDRAQDLEIQRLIDGMEAVDFFSEELEDLVD